MITIGPSPQKTHLTPPGPVPAARWLVVSLLFLAFSIIFVESVLYKAILFVPLVFATLAWIGYYADYKEKQDK